MVAWVFTFLTAGLVVVFFAKTVPDDFLYNFALLGPTQLYWRILLGKPKRTSSTHHVHPSLATKIVRNTRRIMIVWKAFETAASSQMKVYERECDLKVQLYERALLPLSLPFEREDI